MKEEETTIRPYLSTYEDSNTTVLLPSAYLAPIQHYAHLASRPNAMMECYDSYTKQTYRNRCIIAGPMGPMPLTIPVVKPESGKQLMRDIRISDHGNWRHLHWNALKSAYNRSPFFEYYADDFAPFYERRWDFLFDFNCDLQRLVCSLLDIETTFTPTTSYDIHPACADMRPLVDPRTSTPDASGVCLRPYYQVFKAQNGFLPNLSIVDLLFNMGPEGILYLKPER